MTEKEVKKFQQTEHYGHGLMDGVSGRGLFGKQYPAEYLRGHGDGVLFFRDMMDKTRVRLNTPMTSELM